MERECPKCSFVNAQADGTALEECPRCGVIYSKAIARTAFPLTKKPEAQPIRAAPAISDSPSPVSRELPSWLKRFFWPVILPATFVLVAVAVANRMSGDIGAAARNLAWAGIAWFVVLAIIVVAREREKIVAFLDQKFEAEFTKDGYSSKDAFVGVGRSKALVIDPEKQAAILYDFSTSHPARRTVGFKELLSAQLYEDGQTVAVTSSGAGVGRAIVGRMLFGKAGEVIGGVTGKRTTVSHNEVGAIELRLTIKDVRDPIWDMCFLFGGVSKNSTVYKNTSEYARRCAGSLHAAIALAQGGNT